MSAVIVTRKQVTAPPDRFISVSDNALVRFFQGVFSPQQEEQIDTLHKMLEGLCSQDFNEIRRRLEGEFGFFAAAAAGKTSKERVGSWAEVDAQELRFLGDFWEAMRAGHYKFLGKQEWESALSEDFLFTLPVAVDFGAMDTGLLKRFWTHRGASASGTVAEREAAPEELRDSILIFYRGVDVAHMKGKYFSMKVDYLISFLILGPIWRLILRVLQLLKVRVPTEWLAGVFPEAEQQGQQEGAGGAGGGGAGKGAQQAQQQSGKGSAHQHQIRVERRTFARVFPNGPAVLKQFFKTVSLQEACFRDVVVLYRRATDAKKVAGELEIIQSADQAVLARNINIKHFRGIPLADLELVMPEKTVFVPPTVLLQLAVTLILGLVAVWGALKQDKLNLSVVGSAVALLGTRAMQIYTSAQNTRTLIEKQMSKMLYERTNASQEAVLHMMTDEMGKQRVRELFICYCILLHSQTPLTAPQLDHKCEAFLARQFGLTIDFTAEQALPTLLQWGLVAEGKGGALQAVPLAAALERLDMVWDSLFDFSEPAASAASPLAAAKSAGGLFTSRLRLPVGGAKKKPAAPAAAPAPSGASSAGSPAVSAARAVGPASPVSPGASGGAVPQPGSPAGSVAGSVMGEDGVKKKRSFFKKIAHAF